MGTTHRNGTTRDKQQGLSTGSYILYLLINHDEKQYEKESTNICITQHFAIHQKLNNVAT